MANDISSRSWFIDTAAAGVIFQPQVFIKFVEVVGSTAGAQGAVEVGRPEQPRLPFHPRERG